MSKRVEYRIEGEIWDENEMSEYVCEFYETFEDKDNDPDQDANDFAFGIMEDTEGGSLDVFRIDEETGEDEFVTTCEK